MQTVNNINFVYNWKGALGFYLFSTLFGLMESVAFILLIMVPNYTRTVAEIAADSLIVPAIKNESITDKTVSLLLGIIPENLVGSMATGDLISIITMAVVIGCLLIDTEETPSAFTRYISP